MGEGRSHDRDDRGGNVFVLICILVLIVGIVAAAGMVMAVLNYTRENDTPINITVESSGSGKSGYEQGYDTSNGDSSYSSSSGYEYDVGYKNTYDLHYDTRVWTIQTGNLASNLLYIDRKSRQFRGHYIDVFNEVCQLAGKNCAIIHDDWNNCYQNGFPNRGLMGKWYDGCSPYSVTSDRVRSVKFTESFIQTGRPVFLTRRGNPDGFNPDNLAGTKIAFLSNWWANTFCVFSILDYDLGDNQIVEFSDADLSDIVNAVNNGEVDAAFISNELGPANDGSLEVVRVLEPCLLGGDSVMLRKDSLMAYWWDPAFKKLIESRTYREICSDIEDPAVHGGQAGKPADEICVA